MNSNMRAMGIPLLLSTLVWCSSGSQGTQDASPGGSKKDGGSIRIADSSVPVDASRGDAHAYGSGSGSSDADTLDD